MIIFVFILIVLGIVGWILAYAFRNAKQRNSFDDPTDRPSSWQKRTFGWVGTGLVVVAIALVFPSITYTQDRGEVVVQQDWTGNIVGSTTDTGLHWKSPFVNTTTFDILNQQVLFTNTEGENADGGTVTGSDADGVSDEVDVQVQFSIDAASAVDIFTTYHSENDLRSQRVLNDIRTQTREALGSMHTLDVLTKHDDMASLIKSFLLEGSNAAPSWSDIGLSVDSVSVRGTRVPSAVSDSYASAQQSQINVQKAQADLDAQKIQSQQLVQSAQAQADANDLLNAHPLSNGTLVQRYLETLQDIGAKGNLVVIPDGFQGILQLQQQAQQVTGE